MKDPEPETTGGLWRNNPETPEGKYLVKRRDGTIPEWPYFVMGAADGASPDALREYAKQDTQWGGPAHDDTHQPADWVNYIRKFMMRACETNSYSGFEDAMLDVSALAVAAIQSTRRRHDKVGRKCNSCHGTGKLHLAVGQPSDKEACLDCKGHGYYEGSYNGT